MTSEILYDTTYDNIQMSSLSFTLYPSSHTAVTGPLKESCFSLDGPNQKVSQRTVAIHPNIQYPPK